MDYINKNVDENRDSCCIHCGSWSGDVETNTDHVPSKVLLRKPYPDNLPVVKICATCNNGFSADEEYLSLFLHCVLVGSTEPDRHARQQVVRALQRHEKLRARIERSKVVYQTFGGMEMRIWKPETARVERIVIKNARGHAFYECGEPILVKPKHVWTQPLASMTDMERERFESATITDVIAPWPNLGSRMMTRVLTGQDMNNGWIIVQNGVYRFRVEHSSIMVIRSVLYEYLATEVYWSDDDDPYPSGD